MNRTQFRLLLKQAGFKQKSDLAELLGISYTTINQWGGTQDFPRYLEPLLNTLIENKKLQDKIKEQDLHIKQALKSLEKLENILKNIQKSTKE